MKTFKSFLAEAKNTHLEHAEDLVFNEGVNGARNAINYLRSLRDMLAGNSQQSKVVSVKWDGAPAVFAGIDPTDGKFFIAKKGIFNKNPKVYKTPQEVDEDTSGDLAYKLKIALEEFSKLGLKSGVIQGDIMFTHDTVKISTINDEKYVTFHPNTIVYAVPVKDPLAKRIAQAKIGVVWHTTYTGSSFETMSASFGKPIAKKLRHIPSVWMDDATYKDASGVATFNKQETAEITAILSQAGTLFNKINGRALDYISKDEDFLILLKTYNNSKVRAGLEITDTQAHVTGLFHYIYERFAKEIESKKTDKGKQAQIEKRDRILAWFKIYDKSELVKIYDLANLLVKAKHILVAKMDKAGSISTFLKTKNGFKVTSPEGYCAIDHLTGNAVKLVNRMEFSMSNFSSEYQKGWQK